MNNPLSNPKKLPSIPQMELRVKVAELCGWYVERSVGHEGVNGELVLDSGRPPGARRTDPLQRLPNFCNNLNACAEFEKGLTYEQCRKYHEELEWVQAEMTEERNGQEDYPAQDFWFHATAEQRCRAFIATMEGSSVEPEVTKSANAPAYLKDSESLEATKTQEKETLAGSTERRDS